MEYLVVMERERFQAPGQNNTRQINQRVEAEVEVFQGCQGPPDDAVVDGGQLVF